MLKFLAIFLSKLNRLALSYPRDICNSVLEFNWFCATLADWAFQN